jgi:predicted amidophosphoribosyltransferase
MPAAGRWCDKCGTPLPDDARFCEMCGTPVGTEHDQQVETVIGHPPEEMESKR